jgi:hypothetical protein
MGPQTSANYTSALRLSAGAEPKSAISELLAFGVSGQGVKMAGEEEFDVVAVMLFGKRRVDRFPTREQAEWRAKELNEEAERSPRGYIQYVVQPAEKPREER